TTSTRAEAARRRAWARRPGWPETPFGATRAFGRTTDRRPGRSFQQSTALTGWTGPSFHEVLEDREQVVIGRGHFVNAAKRSGRGQIGEPRVKGVGLPCLHDHRVVFESEAEDIVVRQEFARQIASAIGLDGHSVRVLVDEIADL